MKAFSVPICLTLSFASFRKKRKMSDVLLETDMAYSRFGLVDAVGIENNLMTQTCWATTESTGRRIRLNSSKQPHSPP